MAQTTRTPEELAKAEYNYFIALNLDVTETNTQVITKAIAKATGNTSGDIRSRRLLDLRQDMTEILINDAKFNPQTGGYTPHAGGRKEEGNRAREMKLAEIMPLVISTAVSNGMLFKSELNDLCNAANKNAKFFEFADLEKKFLEYNKNNAVKYMDNTTDMIPFSKFDKVSALLETPPGYDSLYEFLKVPRTASTQQIETAHKTAYDEAQKKGDLKTKQTASNLCGEAKDILLKDPKVRKQYDYYIQVRTKVWNMFKLRKTYGAKDMSLNMYYDFAQIMMDELKLDIDTVEQMLGAGLKYYNLVVSGGDGAGDVKGKLGIKDLEVCPYPDCGKIYENGAKVCPHCGKPLEILCWNCGSKMPFTSKSKTCGACGASYLAKDRFIKNTAEIDSLLSAPECDIQRVEMSISGLKNIVNDYKKFTNSAIYKKVSEYESEIEKRRQLEETTGKQYREAVDGVKKFIGEKNYIQAKNAAEALKRKFPTYKPQDTARLIADIDGVIMRARNELNAANGYIAARNEDMAVAALLRAIDICADFNEARQLVLRYPPHPPANVRAEITGNTVKLLWQLPPSRANTTYSVVRKVGSRPANADDGTVITSDLTIDFFEDKSIASATRYFYGVFAVRGGAKSALSPCASPVQIFSDVSNIRQEMVEDKISVKWDAPNNLKAVEVWKKKGIVAPQNPGDGERVNASSEGFTDSATGENSYLIICKYIIDGTEYRSKGVSRLFKNYELLKPIEGVKISQLTNSEFSFEAEVKSGKLRLLFADKKLPCRTGTPLQSASYAEAVKGSREITLNYMGNQMSFMLPQDTAGWIYPLAYNDQLFIVAPPVEVNTVCGIKNIKYAEDGSSGKITGTLHPMVVNVIAKISEKGFINDFNESADTVKLSAAEFKANDGFKLNLKRNTDYYVTVFTEVEVNGKTVLTRGEKLDEAICQRDKTVVKYCLEYDVSPMKPFKLTVKFSAMSEADIPDLIVVKGSPKPLDKSKGEYVEKIAKAPLKKGLFGKEYTYKITLTVPPMSRDNKFSVFPAGDGTGYVQLKEVLKL